MRKMCRHVISQLLYLQMIVLIVDSEYARYILNLHTQDYAINNRLIIVYIPIVNILNKTS